MDASEDLISESAETIEEAFTSVKNQAVEAWGHGNFMLTVSSQPSKNLSTGETLLYTAVAKRIDLESTLSS